MAKAGRAFVCGIRWAGMRTMADRISQSLRSRGVLVHVAELLLLLLPMLLAQTDGATAVGVVVWRCFKLRRLCLAIVSCCSEQTLLRLRKGCFGLLRRRCFVQRRLRSKRATDESELAVVRGALVHTEDPDPRHQLFRRHRVVGRRHHIVDLPESHEHNTILLYPQRPTRKKIDVQITSLGNECYRGKCMQIHAVPGKGPEGPPTTTYNATGYYGAPSPTALGASPHTTIHHPLLSLGKDTQGQNHRVAGEHRHHRTILPETVTSIGQLSAGRVARPYSEPTKQMSYLAASSKPEQPLLVVHSSYQDYVCKSSHRRK